MTEKREMKERRGKRSGRIQRRAARKRGEDEREVGAARETERERERERGGG
jgi:hypothetical protein